MYEKIRSSESSILDGVEIRPYTKWEKLRDRWTHFNEQHSGYILLANFVLLLASISTLFITISISSRHTSTFVEDYIEEFSSYSPARSAVRYVEGVFNTTQGSDSPYVGTANITNEMWDFVTADVGDQMITPEELKLLGKPETSIKVKHPKTGVEGYRIGLEVFHQLHCLNLVRKSTFGDFFKGQGDFAEKDEKKLRGHIDHCLEMLRMNIMCQVDIGVITFHELPGKTGDPYPDFSTKHVCRDFEAVYDWAVANTVANDDIF